MLAFEITIRLLDYSRLVPGILGNHMATGSLEFDLSDLQGAPVQGNIRIRFQPTANTGGTAMEARFESGPATNFTVSGLECRPGPGTLYQVSVESRNYRTYSFFQMIKEGATAKASDNRIRLAIRPWRVKNIHVPVLPLDLVAILPAPNAFDSMEPPHKACLLNVYAKGRDPSCSEAFRFVKKLLLLEQDRMFGEVDPNLEAFLTADPHFKSAPAILHTPLPGYERGMSFKSRDAHANIQFTLLREKTTGRLAADIDIDEVSGIEHGFEVIRNYVTKGKTNPYQIHQLLLLTDLDPGYRLLFG